MQQKSLNKLNSTVMEVHEDLDNEEYLATHMEEIESLQDRIEALTQMTEVMAQRVREVL